MNYLRKLSGRAALPLLLGLLSSCTVYDRIFHPHRLPTPPMSATAKAKARAAEKARHKGTTLKATEAASATDGAGGDAATTPAGAADEKKPLSYSDLPEGTKLKYDKQGLVKKGTLDRLEANRRKLHHYDTRPLTPREASRENRKLRKHGHSDHKDHGRGAKGQPRSQDQPAEPAPDPTQPAPEPTPAPAPKAAKAKDAKAKKAPIPKPDPTQPAPDGSRP